MRAREAMSVLKVTAVIGLAFMSGAKAFADDKEVQIPSDAMVLYQASYSRSHIDKADAVAGVTQEILAKESKVDVEYKCQAVYYKWTYDSQIKCNEDPGLRFAGGCLNPLNFAIGKVGTYTEQSVTVTAYCKPRSYDQKIVLSLARHCEEVPTAECLDERIKSGIATIQPTVRYEIDKPE
jgi:hypothetical protein